ncbi:MAG: hypothetical protein R2932_04625 [Caldilineaceae bacterium]
MKTSATSESTRAPKEQALTITRSGKRFLFWVFLALFTVSFSQPIAATAEACVPLLADGSLEEGTAWKVKNSDGFPLLSQQLVRTGRQAAYLGGRYNVADRLATVLRLPATDQTITLRFWWQLQSQEQRVGGNDRLTVLVANKQSLPLQTLVELNGRNVVHDWQSMSIDLTHFAGQMIELQFLASTDAELNTDFFIDDIEVVACDSAG